MFNTSRSLNHFQLQCLAPVGLITTSPISRSPPYHSTLSATGAMFSTSRSHNHFQLQCSAPVGLITTSPISRSPPYHSTLPAIPFVIVLLSCVCRFHQHENCQRDLQYTIVVARLCDSFTVSFCKNCLSTIDPPLICPRNTFSLFPKLSISPAVTIQSIIISLLSSTLSFLTS